MKKTSLEETFTLPKNWCIRWGSKDQFEIIKEYFIGKNKWVPYPYCYASEDHKNAFTTHDGEYISPYQGDIGVYEEITFEQFKKYVVNSKIVAYKVKEGMLKFVNNFFNTAMDSESIAFLNTTESQRFKMAKEGGVLDMWFYPIYEKRLFEATLKHDGGEMQLKINEDGAIFVNDENVDWNISKFNLLAPHIFYVNGIEIVTYPERVDVGYKKNILVKDALKILNDFKEFYK